MSRVLEGSPQRPSGERTFAPSGRGTAPLVLASASPRRRALLDSIGLRFEVDAADVPEVQAEGESPCDFALRVALDKASVVAARRSGVTVIGADTIVVVDDVALGKPRDADDACRMLRLLSGRTHQVMTAVAIVAPSGAAQRFVETSEVTFRPLSEQEIEAYVAGGEPFDKAGGYAIQGDAAAFVIGLRGSLSNVIGLPIEAVSERLNLPRTEADGMPAA